MISSRIAAVAVSAVALTGLSLTPAVAGQHAIPLASGPFKIGPSDSPGSVVLEPSGTKVAVFDISSGHGKTHVCSIGAKARKCTTSVYLTPLAGDSTFGQPGVFIPSKSHVVVLQGACCDSDPDSTLLYTSTDGGHTFPAPVRVGSLLVDASELIGGHILWTEQNDSAGLQVVSIAVGATGASPTATISTRGAFDVGVGQYNGGALVGTDHLGKGYTSYLYYASKGKNFDSASSYKLAGTFGGEQLIGMSGKALLTVRGKHNSVVLRMFGGSKFGTAHTVPHVHGGVGTWLTVEQDPRGHVHVFAIMSTSSYHLLEVSTSDGGASWTKAVNLGNGINSTYLSAAIAANGSGMVLGNTPAWAYPVK